ncbi:restriction endonuclease [Clostridium sp. SHJSY1]|uniref:restriction endonuclease n=1 Tax=Clostridium sp. SHJSY1 TaxID=2942483 RepID=UPI002875375E|nr:restriction endonuclease [Clostridium sp. SHJSY1]MDS0525940.1 restriction endonuclease [Clostridium sp. SHJSY1]
MPVKYLYSERVYNEFLDVSKVIKAETSWELNRKIREQLASWREKEEKKRKKQRSEDLEYQTEQDTIESIQKIEKYKDILLDSLKIDHSIELDSLKKTYEFKEFIFREEPPTLKEINIEVGVPIKNSTKEFLFKSVKKKRIKLENEAQSLFKERKKEYEEKREIAKRKYEEEKLNFTNGVKSFNDSIDEFKINLEKGEEKAIERYVNLVLEKSIYPYEIRKQYEIQYDPSNKILIISYDLPMKEEIPIITEYKYIAARKEIIEVRMEQKEFEEYYEDVLYKICLRNIYEVFQALKIDEIKKIVFNGWIYDVDKKTENYFRACIMSVQTSREEFTKLELGKVNPKEYFRKLKGISGALLYDLTPVKPILDLNHNDLRFIQSKEVQAGLDNEINLEELGLEVFEDLIKELFKKVFSGKNCDVKIAKSSRERGLELIVIDKDKIRGGKFLIRAKQYDEEVHVANVKDLYSTMLSEKANKGILITTSYYGDKSREFSKGKSIILIGGEDLVQLFKEYGYKVKIKLKNKNV